MADTVLKDPKLAILLLREISAKYRFVKQSATHFSGHTDRGEETLGDLDTQTPIDSPHISNNHLFRLNSVFGCPDVNSSTEGVNTSSCTNWTSTVRVWNVPNSLGFVISALTTIGTPIFSVGKTN